MAPERTEEWLRVFGVKAPASTTHHYQFYLDDYETDPSTQPWLLWPLATKLWSIYHEFFAQLTPELQYALRLYIDCVLATTEPEDVYKFPLRMSDGPLPLERVPSQDSLPIEPRLALYHHVDKWIYHSRRLTAAQENRIPYLKLIRRCRPQKFNANKEFVTRDSTDNDKRVLRHWTLVTRLGNYRHANVPSLGTSLRERQLALFAPAPTTLTTLACREFLVYAVHDDPALFKTLDQQRHGAWTRYRQATIRAANGYRLSMEPPTAYFKETQGDLARLMIPVSFWEATLPLFRRLGAPYDIVSPEFVARMASVFRYAHGTNRIEWHKSLIESVPFAAKEKLVEIMTRYYSSATATTWNVLDWSGEKKDDLDLLYSLCLAHYYAKTVFLVSLESHALDAQFDALMHRSRGDADVATKAMQFVACPSCFKEHSMVCRPLPGSSTSTTTTTTTRRRKRAKVFTASAVAGLSKVRINIHSMEVYCGRKSGKKRSQCMRAPVCRFPLLGQLLCFRGVFYTLCTRPECGIVTVFDPVTSKTSDPVCASCSSSVVKPVATNNGDEEEDLYYYDYADEDLDPETGEPELYRGVRVKRKYKI